VRPTSFPPQIPDHEPPRTVGKSAARELLVKGGSFLVAALLAQPVTKPLGCIEDLVDGGLASVDVRL
jgi:hypothetical protein